MQTVCWTLVSVRVDIATAQPVAKAAGSLLQGPWGGWLAGALRTVVTGGPVGGPDLMAVAHVGLRVFEAVCRYVCYF